MAERGTITDWIRFRRRSVKIDAVEEGPGKITTAMEEFTVVIDGESHWQPPLRYMGHEPDIVFNERGTYCGCKCGWRSRARTNNGLESWWSHAFRTAQKEVYVRDTG